MCNLYEEKKSALLSSSQLRYYVLIIYYLNFSLPFKYYFYIVFKKDYFFSFLKVNVI